jgi:hypothetical protein
MNSVASSTVSLLTNRRLMVAAVLGFGLLGISVTASAATVTFTDNAFLDADWSATKIIDTTAGATASFVAAQVATGGNPDSYRQVQHTYDAGIIAVAHLKSDAIYDPSVTGAIQSIAYSYDLIHFNPPPAQAVAYGIALLQNGVWYRTSFDTIFPEVWTGFAAANLTAANFALAAGTGPTNPDFSATGAAMTFGYASFNNNTGGNPDLVRLSGIDNWQVTVTSVPLPPAAWLLGTAAASLVLRGRFRTAQKRRTR